MQPVATTAFINQASSAAAAQESGFGSGIIVREINNIRDGMLTKLPLVESVISSWLKSQGYEIIDSSGAIVIFQE